MFEIIPVLNIIIWIVIVCTLVRLVNKVLQALDIYISKNKDKH